MKLLDKKWKWAVAGILLLGVAVVIFIYIFWTCCAPPKSDSDSILSDPNLLYAKRALIGLCRTKSGNNGSCHFNTYLYSLGKLVIESGELVWDESGDEKAIAYPTVQRELDKNLMNKIIKKIRDSVITNKLCETDTAVTGFADYYVNYFINLDGVKKEVKFPGCESEFNEIDKLIDTAADK